nr:MAG TPA: tail completion protein [Caudoviricetes sp.]
MDIIKGIGKQLAKILDKPTIYRENQPQGFKEPSFYVYEISTLSKDEITNYEMRTHRFCVVYFPDSKKDVNKQLDTMRDTLLDNFLVIDDVNLKLYERKCEPIDGTLNFTFKVRYRGKYEQTDTPMNALSQKGGLLNGG